MSGIYATSSYRPEDSLGFLLGRCLNRIVDEIDVALAEYDVTAEQFGVLHAIYRGKATNPSELARLRYRHSAAITYTLDVLEKRKLLARKRSRADRRVITLQLTPAGTDVTRACIPRVVEAQNQVLRTVDREDYDLLSGLLKRIAYPTTRAIAPTGTGRPSVAVAKG